MNNVTTTQLELNLKVLKLTKVLENYKSISKEVLEEKLTNIDLLCRLTEVEIEHRKNKKIATILKGAKFPIVKTLDNFDFKHIPTIKKDTILELIRGNFLSDATNIVLYGPPGTGKTHLTISIGRELCLQGYKVIFLTACELVQELVRARQELCINKLFKKYDRYKLVCIDELGYVPFNKSEAELLFQFISNRYEKSSLLITSNLVFSEWDKVFQNTITTSAVVDRIIHHCVILECNAKSYRLNNA